MRRRALLLAAPTAFPRAPGVKNLDPLRLQRDDVGGIVSLGEHNPVAIVHVLRPLREQLPEQAATATPTLSRRVKQCRVDSVNEHVPKRRVELFVLG